MKLKLIFPLMLAVCLPFFIAPVQAQDNAIEDMDEINVIIAGNITKAVECNVTGNVVIVEEAVNVTDNVTDNMIGNMTDNMTDSMTDNMTGKYDRQYDR